MLKGMFFMSDELDLLLVSGKLRKVLLYDLRADRGEMYNVYKKISCSHFSELTEYVVRVLDCRDLGSSRNLLACEVDLELVGRDVVSKLFS